MPTVKKRITDEFWSEFEQMNDREKDRCLRGMDRAELLEMRDRLQRKKANIEKQLNQAKSEAQHNGDYSDPEWFTSAKHALKMTGLNIQKVQDLLSQMDSSNGTTEGALRFLTPDQKAGVRQMAFGQALAEILRDELGEDLASSLIEKANNRVEEAM